MIMISFVMTVLKTSQSFSLVNIIEYKSSFLHQHCLTYIVQEDKMQAKIQINFPLLPRILKSYLYDIMNKVSNKEDIIGQYPAVKGYLLEFAFLVPYIF